MKIAYYNYTRDPAATKNFSKKVVPDLSHLRMLLIDTAITDPMFEDALALNFLGPLGAKQPVDCIVPLLSLPEHGGMVLSMRDYMSPGPANATDAWGKGGPSSRAAYECLLDREQLTQNMVQVLAQSREEVKKAMGKDVYKTSAFGFPMPQVTAAVVDPENLALCPPNCVGEIWVDSPALSGGFWALAKHTESIFHARPLYIGPNEQYARPLEQEFLRTGLLGCVVDGKRLVVFGLYEDRIRQRQVDSREYRFYYTPDIGNSIAAKIPIADTCVAFEVCLNDQYLPVIIMESSRPEDELGGLALQVLRVCHDAHRLHIFSVVIVQAGSLPRSLKNGRLVVNTEMSRKAYEIGALKALYVKVNVDKTIQDLANANVNEWEQKPLPPGLECTQHSGIHLFREIIDERTGTDLTKFKCLMDILIWRTSLAPDENVYVTLDSKGKELKPLPFRKFNIKIVGMATALEKKNIKAGDHVILMYSQSVELTIALYACLVIGAIAIPLATPDPSRIREDIITILGVCHEYPVAAIVCNNAAEEIFKSKLWTNALKSMRQTTGYTVAYHNAGLAGSRPSVASSTSLSGDTKKLARDGSTSLPKFPPILISERRPRAPNCLDPTLGTWCAMHGLIHSTPLLY